MFDGESLHVDQENKENAEHVAALKAGQKGCKKPPRTAEHIKNMIESRTRNRLAKLQLLEA